MENHRVLKLRLLPPSPKNPRNSEGSIIQLKDERLLLGYTHFYGGRKDNSPAKIAGRFSEDGGKTWSTQDMTIQENEGRENVMSVTLLRLNTGEIALFYLIKHSWGDCKLYMRKSADEAKTWGEKVCATPHEGYHIVNNDRVIQLSSGRLVVPAAYHPCRDETRETWSRKSISMCFLSDDNGTTWYKSKTELHGPEKSHTGLQEPGVVELKDGSLMMLTRTDQGSQFRSYSYDDGETWSPAEPTDLASPVSPATLKRIPSTGDLLLIWNDHSGEYAKFGNKRTPLTTAISHDEGNSWGRKKILESDPDGWFCYTSLTFVGEKALLSYCAGNSKIGGLCLLQVTLVDISWFYD